MRDITGSDPGWKLLPQQGASTAKHGKPTAINKLLRAVASIESRDTCLQALERFHAAQDLFALPVVDANQRPIALLERHAYVEFLGRLFGREVFGKRTLEELIVRNGKSMAISEPIVVEANANIDDVARMIVDSRSRRMVNGIILTQDERYVGLVCGLDLFSEVTQRKQDELYYLAHYDALTSVPNRMLFNDRLNQACLEVRRRGGQLALMLIDLDRFKQVNDSLGHRFGDHLLQAVARRLQGNVRDCDTVARLGGDEFAVLMDEINAPEEAGMLALRLVESMRQPFPILDREVHAGLSIGISIYPGNDADVGLLLSQADAAMYEAKMCGRNTYRYYAPSMSTYSVEQLSLESDMKRALTHDEFVLYYQPQFAIHNAQVVGVEALIRWQHPKLGLLSPGSFIGIAEESGMIVAMGDWVLARACMQLKEWHERGLPFLRMAVNISSLQFRQPNFAERVKACLSEAGIRPDLLELELTESMVMKDSEQILQALLELKALGVRLSLDDFGTGFSSLSYLRRFPIERLKIDQSFVRNVDQIPVNRSIIDAIIALARSLSLEVVAEGVERAEELDVVRSHGCDESQGYYHARPMSAAQFVDWLQTRHIIGASMVSRQEWPGEPIVLPGEGLNQHKASKNARVSRSLV